MRILGLNVLYQWSGVIGILRYSEVGDNNVWAIITHQGLAISSHRGGRVALMREPDKDDLMLFAV